MLELWRKRTREKLSVLKQIIHRETGTGGP